MGAVLALLLLCAPALRSASTEIKFAVPADGRITLGVFDRAGKLVRLLHNLENEENFRIGNNGLITSWDGKDDNGGGVAAGAYHVRGYLVGDDVRVSGERFLFNDWAADNGFRDFRRIRNFSLLENGDVLLLVDAGFFGDLLARFSPENGFLWSVSLRGLSGASPVFESARTTDPAGRPLGSSVFLNPASSLPPDFPPLLAVNSTEAIVMTTFGNGIYSLKDGREVYSSRPGAPSPLALAANDSRIFVATKTGLMTIPLPLQTPEGGGAQPAGEPAGEPAGQLPSAWTTLDADAAVLLGASPEGVWIRRESFAPITLPVTVQDVSLGTSDTFWFVGLENETPLVGQASFAGEILRLLRPAPGDPKPEKIRASRSSEKFAVLESLSGLQRLRVMARTEAGEWVIEWERTRHDSPQFGFVDGKPVADAGSAPQSREIRVRLKENPLSGRHDFLSLHAESGKFGSRLVSPDGLPLVDISSRPDIRRVVICRDDKADALSVLQGNGAFVEEFSITGLDDILPLDAGGIDIP